MFPPNISQRKSPQACPEFHRTRILSEARITSVKNKIWGIIRFPSFVILLVLTFGGLFDSFISCLAVFALPFGQSLD
jgi:hypothetical protein